MAIMMVLMDADGNNDCMHLGSSRFFLSICWSLMCTISVVKDSKAMRSYALMLDQQLQFDIACRFNNATLHIHGEAMETSRCRSYSSWLTKGSHPAEAFQHLSAQQRQSHQPSRCFACNAALWVSSGPCLLEACSQGYLGLCWKVL